MRVTAASHWITESLQVTVTVHWTSGRRGAGHWIKMQPFPDGLVPDSDTVLPVSRPPACVLENLWEPPARSVLSVSVE